MKLISNFILLLIFSLTQFDHKTARIAKTISSDTLQQQSTKYVILPVSLRDSNITGFDNSYKETTLSEDEIKQLKELITKAANNYNKSCKHCPSDLKIKNTSRYYKQFVPALNTKGEKEVWVNCLWDVDDIKKLQNHIIFVFDGGAYYFRVKINLTTKKILSFGVNGLA